MKILTRVVLEAKRNSSGRRAQAEYAKKHPNSDVAKRVAARAYGAKPNSAGLENDFIGRFKPKEGQHARHMQTGMTAKERATDRGAKDTALYKTGRVKARQIVRRGGKIPSPTGEELDNLVSRTRANQPPAGRGHKVKRVGPSGNEKTNEGTAIRSLKYLRIDEISAEKYDAMSGKERSDYAANVARRYRKMAAAKQAKDKNFTPDKDLSRPLSAHREIKDRAYARAGRHEELKKLRARRKQPLRRASMGGRDPGEEAAREAGDRP